MARASLERLTQLLRSQPYGKTTALWKKIALEYWELYLPDYAATLKGAGTATLHGTAQEAAEKTVREISRLVRDGMPYQQAEELVRGKYIMLPPEQEDGGENSEEM